MRDSTFLAYLIQAFIFVFPILASYPAYRWVRAPQKQTSVRKALRDLGLETSLEIQDALSKEYTARDYVWPVFSGSAVTVVVFAFTHPWIIETGVWSGLLEEMIDVFGNDTYARDLIAGRFLYWGWLGAYIYTVQMVIRRFLAYDLTPSVYIFATMRFLLAMIIGAIVGVALGTLNKSAGMVFDVNLMTVSVVAFFIGFFPERGLDWIGAMAKRTLGQQEGIAMETRLSELEGLSIWHQGRLRQEGIENVQNLAMSDIPGIIVGAPFTVSQVIDWVDQSILLVYANDEVYRKIESVGIRCASDFLTVMEDEEKAQMLSDTTGVDVAHLKMLNLAVQSSSNVKVTSYFRWRSSMDKGRMEAAEKLIPFRAHSRETIEMMALQSQSQEIKTTKSNTPPDMLLPATD